MLLTAVTLAHLWLGSELVEHRFGFGAGAPAIPRIEVAYVRELTLAPAPPPPAPPRPAPRPARRVRATPPPASAPRGAERPQVVARAERPEVPSPAEPSPALALAETVPTLEPAPVQEAASAPMPAASTPVVPPAPMPPIASAPAPASAAAAATAAAATASAAATAAPFEWPPSTRLSYRLNGNYRGEVQGSASVEWIRVGLRYQVHMEALVGPSFAPLLARRVSSEGELGENGLTPQRFQGEQRFAFKSRRWAMRFDATQVHLPNGRDVPTMAGVQDEASWFVQLTWIFMTQPQLLRVGRTVAMPLALPRRVELWHYDVIDAQTLTLPFGDVPTLHVKPRRVARPGGDMTAELWFAPGLQYLPVRILIRQDEENFVDLTLERPPQQAAAAAPPAASTREPVAVMRGQVMVQPDRP
ncbi:MAG: DUF3108 domain-containing protein [Nitrospira sp.]|nr:DUF3108 domain-containing protein [Nitrospira sp.]